MTTLFRRQSMHLVEPGTPQCVSNLCSSGRGLCPTPQACQVPEAETDTAPHGFAAVVAWWLPVLVPFVGVIALAAAAIYWPL